MQLSTNSLPRFVHKVTNATKIASGFAFLFTWRKIYLAYWRSYSHNLWAFLVFRVFDIAALIIFFRFYAHDWRAQRDEMLQVDIRLFVARNKVSWSNNPQTV